MPKLGDLFAGLFFMGLGIGVTVGAIRLGLGKIVEPEPGFFPFLSGCFFALLALVVLLRSFVPGRGFQAKISSFWKGLNWHRPLAVGLLILVYILMLERAGFLLTSLILLFFMLRWVEKFSWWKALLISASASACTYLLFHTLLKATLPIGILGI